MAILAIDTAGPDCAVAVARRSGADLEILARDSDRIGRGHSDALMPMIEATLARAGRDYADLCRVVVTVGPGSFTGIRVGIAAARGLALALDIPAAGVGVLDALAQSLVDGGLGTVVAVLDAKRGEVYAAAVERRSGLPLLPACAASVEDLAARLAETPGPILLVGSGAALLQAELARQGQPAEVAGLAETADIAVVVGLGTSAAPGPPVPLYLRGADAKEQSGKAVARR